jgi:hypothetical protein
LLFCPFSLFLCMFCVLLWCEMSLDHLPWWKRVCSFSTICLQGVVWRRGQALFHVSMNIHD